MNSEKKPVEYQPLPPEHVIPEEYPVSKPVAETAKKSNAHRLIAMCLTGFVAIQLMFSYFVPPTDDNKEDDPTGPAWTEPGPGSGPSVQPGYDIGDFQIRPLSENVDDTELTPYLVDAAANFESFDHVRASIGLYTSMLFYKTNVSPYELNQVGYTISGDTVSEFNAAIPGAAHVYYEKDEIFFENKIGELESYQALRGTLVLFEEKGGATHYRVLTIMISMDDSYALYGAYFSYGAEYIDGVFDTSGRSELCKKTAFSVSENYDYSNLDGQYAVSGDNRLTGSVSDGAFMNGTYLESDIVYDEVGDFVENSYRPGRNATFNDLLEDGCLDLNSAAVLDQSTGYNVDAWETFTNDPSIRYLAYTTSLVYKFDNSEETGELYDLDITAPLLPLEMHAAFCIRQITADAQPDDGGTDTPNADFSLYSPGLIKASDYLMNNDYVGASVALTDTFAANYISGQGDMNLVYVDGSIQTFSGQDLTGGTGVYISLMEQIVMVYNEKVDDYDPEMHLFATLIFAEDLNNGIFDTNIISIEIPYYYLGQNDTYTFAEAEYLDALVDEDFHGDMELVTYYLYGSTDTGNTNNRDGYQISGGYQVISCLTGGVAGLETTYKDCGLFLSDDKTAVIPKGALKDYANILDLASDGVLAPPNTLACTDLCAMEASSDEFNAAWDAALANPDVRYILYTDSSGSDVLYVKNVIYVEGESHRGIWIPEEEWAEARFPLNDTLSIWISIYRQIRQ